MVETSAEQYLLKMENKKNSAFIIRFKGGDEKI